MYDLLGSVGRREHDYIVCMCDRENVIVCRIENVIINIHVYLLTAVNVSESVNMIIVIYLCWV